MQSTNNSRIVWKPKRDKEIVEEIMCMLAFFWEGVIFFFIEAFFVHS